MSEKNTFANEPNERNVMENILSLRKPAQEEIIWETGDEYTREERERLTKLYSSTLMDVTEQQIVTGKIVAIDDREVVVNIGFKSDGIIPLSEFRDMQDLKVGDSVEVLLETVENKSGQMVLSRRLANSMRTWERINQAMDSDIIMTGTVKRRTRGGFVVDLEGIEAFLPGSQVDVKQVRDYESYVGQKMEFKIVKINHQQHNVVISHKALIEKDLEHQKAEIINNLEKGQVLEGTVKNITKFGVFIDLGGVDGLLHITDISWGRINSPEEVLTLDQKINVVVLDFDDERKRISLGLKQLQPHPWDNLAANFEVGSRVKGKVVTIADYGVFIEVVPGVEGLIHVSEMSWSLHPKSPYELFHLGDEIEAVVLTLDKDDRKMSLGLKQLTPDPWEKAIEKYAVGTRHSGVVRNIVDYGLFVEIEEGIDGFVHIQELSWSKKINHPSEFIQKDQTLEVIVLEIEPERRRLRLGHKQLTEDPWETLETVFPVGSIHTGTITKMSDRFSYVELEYGVEGQVSIKNLKAEAGKPELKEGDQAQFKVIEFNKDAKKIVLSHTDVWKEAAEAEKEKTGKSKKKSKKEAEHEDFVVPTLPVVEKDTLGSLEALAGLKASLEKEETPKAPEAAE